MDEITELTDEQKKLGTIIIKDLANSNGNYGFIYYERYIKQLKEETGVELTLKDVKKIMLQLEVYSLVEEHCCNSSYRLRTKGFEYLGGSKKE